MIKEMTAAELNADCRTYKQLCRPGICAGQDSARIQIFPRSRSRGCPWRVPLLTPLNSSMMNVILCLVGSVLFRIELGALSGVVLKKTSLG